MKVRVESDEDEILGKAYDGRLMRRLVPDIRPYWRRIVLSLILLLGTSLLDLTGPFYQGRHRPVYCAEASIGD